MDRCFHPSVCLFFPPDSDSSFSTRIEGSPRFFFQSFMFLVRPQVEILNNVQSNIDYKSQTYHLTDVLIHMFVFFPPNSNSTFWPIDFFQIRLLQSRGNLKDVSKSTRGKRKWFSDVKSPYLISFHKQVCEISDSVERNTRLHKHNQNCSTPLQAWFVVIALRANVSMHQTKSGKSPKVCSHSYFHILQLNMF